MGQVAYSQFCLDLVRAGILRMSHFPIRFINRPDLDSFWNPACPFLPCTSPLHLLHQAHKLSGFSFGRARRALALERALQEAGAFFESRPQFVASGCGFRAKSSTWLDAYIGFALWLPLGGGKQRSVDLIPRGRVSYSSLLCVCVCVAPQKRFVICRPCAKVKNLKLRFAREFLGMLSSSTNAEVGVTTISAP